jgi:phosphate transport system permease protein
MSKPAGLGLRRWWQSGQPWIWLSAGAVALSILMVLGVVGLIAARGLVHFWPGELIAFEHRAEDGSRQPLLARLIERDAVPAARLAALGVPVPEGVAYIERWMLKTGNRDLTGEDFRWLLAGQIDGIHRPADALVIERAEWGDFHGYLRGIEEAGQPLPLAGEDLRVALRERLARKHLLARQIRDLERGPIGALNARMERLRRVERRADPTALADIRAERAGLEAAYDEIVREIVVKRQALERDTLLLASADGREFRLPMAQVIDVLWPNDLSVGEQLAWFGHRILRFLREDPREANTEGGVFPAIFGTVLMVLLMSVVVTPFGVIAAVYLREYARQGPVTQAIRIAVNNLAGVPSVVYGVFGLGFFVYFLGGNIDTLFFTDALPAPTFGTPGVLWASLTLALLTVPVVIVSTEEGLARIPRSIREGSLALGATKAETLFRTVLPMATPAIMTGVILAVARAAGEVAPLMLVGVVKLAPALPIDGNFPWLHLDRKFMHLGFHIYDTGFQSPNVEAARPLVYATALLLVVLIVVLNLAAISLRNRLREMYHASEN